MKRYIMLGIASDGQIREQIDERQGAKLSNYMTLLHFIFSTGNW
jgi:hypothetical protein